MSEYPEHDKLSAVASQTQAIGEFVEWLEDQGVQLMTYREDLIDVRPTDPDCRMRRRQGHGENRKSPCWPTRESDVGSADYYDTHCLHWHGREYVVGDDLGAEPGTCCWCGKGLEYEVTTRGWVHEQRGTERLLADWSGIDLRKIKAEKRQMLASIRTANEGASRG
ncbi:MAG TPA: hypothetical protein VGH54_11435 [Mycobacterium sp.]|uniref:hypothetical protein n=1 Tax=Mycobacterium sp. TaxID=1785 RepID=UPI002F42DF82